MGDFSTYSEDMLAPIAQWLRQGTCLARAGDPAFDSRW